MDADDASHRGPVGDIEVAPHGFPSVVIDSQRVEELPHESVERGRVLEVALVAKTGKDAERRPWEPRLHGLRDRHRGALVMVAADDQRGRVDVVERVPQIALGECVRHGSRRRSSDVAHDNRELVRSSR